MKKIKKRFLAGASSSILASMLLFSSGHVYADTIEAPIPAYTSRQESGMHMMHRFNSVTKINSLALQLGLNPEDVRAELSRGKSVKELLLDKGITGTELEKAFYVKSQVKKSKKS